MCYNSKYDYNTVAKYNLKARLSYENSCNWFKKHYSSKFSKIYTGLCNRNNIRRGKGFRYFAREYALANNLKLTEILPDYKKYGRYAPLKRNLTIAANANMVIAFWDGESKGTKFVIDTCEKNFIPILVLESSRVDFN